MLVLSRQRDETIMIGDEVEITVVDIRGDKVRLGITAPARIAVHRKEVYDAIRAENEQAARVADPDLARLNGLGPVPRSPAKSASRAPEILSQVTPGHVSAGPATAGPASPRLVSRPEPVRKRA